MGIRVPSDIQDLEIPSYFDVRGGIRALGNLFANAVDANDIRAAQERRIGEQHQKKTEHDLGVSGEAKNAGIRSSGSAAATITDREANEKERDKNAKDAVDRQLLLAAQRLASFESDLASQYGENFDLDLLGEMHANGHFTDEEYARFASIEDVEERRKAIAQAIQDKIDAGEIDPATLKDHPWALDWLDLHEDARDARDLDAKLALEGQKSANEISVEAKDEAVVSASGQQLDARAQINSASVDSMQGASVDQSTKLTMSTLGV
jgi:hypothetical protein